MCDTLYVHKYTLCRLLVVCTCNKQTINSYILLMRLERDDEFLRHLPYGSINQSGCGGRKRRKESVECRV